METEFNQPVADPNIERTTELFHSGVLEIPDVTLQPITDFGQLLFGAARVQVSILDNRYQWSKAASGLAGIDCALEDSFCQYVVGDERELVVSDADADSRFADKACVTGPEGLKFYAGVPLRLGERRRVVGTLCLSDPRPRAFADRDLQLLRGLGQMAETTLAEFVKGRVTGENAADRDPVTGLGNAAWFRDRLASLIGDAEVTGYSVQLAFLDIERMQDLLVANGIAAANAALAEVANRLHQDMPGDAALARWQDDIFVAAQLVPPESEPGGLGERARQVFDRPFTVDAERLRLAARVGGTGYPDDARTADDLLQYASYAARQAARGSASLHLYNPANTQRLHRRLVLERRLGQAVEAERMPQLVYQPKTDLRTGRVTGAETLMRWHDAELGRVSPGEFLPAAVESGLIHELGRRALGEAAGEAAAWPDFTDVAVNASVGEVTRPGFAQAVRAALGAARLPPERLTVELTEESLVDPDGTVAAVMTELGADGVRFAIDDFGTGYASFQYLQSLPVHALKIDRSFIRHIETRYNDYRIAKAIVAMGHELNLKLVAEGVETAGQARLLADLGCDVIQGFLVAPGLAAERVRALLGTVQLAAETA